MLILTLLAGLCFLPSAQAWAAQAEPKDTDLVLIFDASGSMNESVQGGRKLDVAKDAMWKFVDSLPKNVNIGLVALGGYCSVTTLLPVKKSAPAARQELKKAMAGLQANGSTPIGGALDRAAQLLAASKNKKRIVAMTDGDETCSGPQLAAASDAAWRQGVKVYAIGFAFGKEPSLNFRRIGIYKDANDEKQLASVFTDIRKTLERETGKFDESQSAQAEKPPVSFVGRMGRFKPSGGERAGRLFTSLQLSSSFERRFDENDRFKVLEHGYDVKFNEADFKAEKAEVLRVRLEEKLNFQFSGAEGFVFADDVVIE
ncbi:MAG: VWA domain-containing protein [Elusimicrobia bacterium]|nr:VWA domain-containing protein [Elusimicrobiota bacterium]